MKGNILSMSIQEISTVVGAVVVAVLSFVQITPIKINPWSSLFNVIKKLLYGDILSQINDIDSKLDKHIQKDELDGIKSCRLRILRFNDELIQGIKHTKEHFDEILDDISTYEKYCDTHDDYENAKAEMAIENVKRVYRHCEETNGFL